MTNPSQTPVTELSVESLKIISPRLYPIARRMLENGFNEPGEVYVLDQQQQQQARLSSYDVRQANLLFLEALNKDGTPSSILEQVITDREGRIAFGLVCRLIP